VLDPTTRAVITAGLIDGVAEMKAVVLRTAYSNLWKEAGDLSCALLTPSHELVVQGPADIPNHLGSMPFSLAGCLARIPEDSLQPGDVLLQNDPYSGNNHLPDLFMAKPVFVDETLLCWTAVRGHWVDVGGLAPGSYSNEATDLYGEGIRIPPVKIYRAGVLNEDVADLLLANTRNPDERFGDLQSQFAGCFTGEQRVLAYCERYGLDALKTTMDHMLDSAEQLTRSAIERIPDGEYTFEDWCDGDGIDYEPIRIAARVTVAGSDVTVDLSESSPQVRGGMNCPYAVTVAAAFYAIKVLTDPENPPNSGCYRPIEVIATPGSVLNPRPPAPVVASNHETSYRVVDAVIGALAGALEDRVCAAGSGTSGVLIMSWNLKAEAGAGGSRSSAVHLEVHGAGQGAHAAGDGVNARRVNMGNTGNTPIEVLEASFPITSLTYEIAEDCGGPGRFRGGTGIRRLMRLDEDTIVTLAAERAVVPPYGLAGGGSARRASYAVILPDGSREELRSKTRPTLLPKGTVVEIRCAGGGGFGSCLERQLERIQDDLDDGYISPESARDVYAVALEAVESRSEGPWVVRGRLSDGNHR
jgi:N-methylhydantoinase B